MRERYGPAWRFLNLAGMLASAQSLLRVLLLPRWTNCRGDVSCRTPYVGGTENASCRGRKKTATCSACSPLRIQVSVRKHGEWDHSYYGSAVMRAAMRLARRLLQHSFADSAVSEGVHSSRNYLIQQVLLRSCVSVEVKSLRRYHQDMNKRSLGGVALTAS